MLSGMLLHIGIAGLPIYLAGNLLPGNKRHIHNMMDNPVFDLYIKNRMGTDGSGICILPAFFREEDSLVKNDVVERGSLLCFFFRGRVRLAGKHGGIKRSLVRIVTFLFAA